MPIKNSTLSRYTADEEENKDRPCYRILYVILLQWKIGSDFSVHLIINIDVTYSAQRKMSESEYVLQFSALPWNSMLEALINGCLQYQTQSDLH